MAHPWHHSLSSARIHGGKPQDYQAIHHWFDETKKCFADPRHRAMRHHSEGIYLCESVFGVTITNSAGKDIPVRVIGEQHVKEDLGHIPTMADWLRCMRRERWMNSNVTKIDDEGRYLRSRQPIRKGELYGHQ